MLVFGLIVIALFLLAIGVLALPVRVRFQGGKHPGWYFRLAVELLGGWEKEILLSGERSKQKFKKWREKIQAEKRFWRFLKNREVIVRGFELVPLFCNSVKWERARLWLCFGLEDPADTGRLAGALMPWCYGMPSSRWLELQVEPNFETAHLDFEGEGKVGLVPLKILWIFMRFMCSLSSLKALWHMIRRNR